MKRHAALSIPLALALAACGPGGPAEKCSTRAPATAPDGLSVSVDYLQANGQIGVTRVTATGQFDCAAETGGCLASIPNSLETVSVRGIEYDRLHPGAPVSIKTFERFSVVLGRANEEVLSAAIGEVTITVDAEAMPGTRREAVLNGDFCQKSNRPGENEVWHPSTVTFRNVRVLLEAGF